MLLICCATYTAATYLKLIYYLDYVSYCFFSIRVRVSVTLILLRSHREKMKSHREVVGVPILYYGVSTT